MTVFGFSITREIDDKLYTQGDDDDDDDDVWSRLKLPPPGEGGEGNNC